MKKYKIIYADPAWSYSNSSKKIHGIAENHYVTMSNQDIYNLPIKDIADDNSILFLWATFPKIQEALNTIKEWGFTYKTVGFTWMKTNRKNGKPVFGIGWYTKSNAEVCLIGIRGKAPKISNSISSMVIANRDTHSKKPNEVRERIVKFCGDVPRIELFAREKVEGWDSWGNEVENTITFNEK